MSYMNPGSYSIYFNGGQVGQQFLVSDLETLQSSHKTPVSLKSHYGHVEELDEGSGGTM